MQLTTLLLACILAGSSLHLGLCAAGWQTQKKKRENPVCGGTYDVTSSYGTITSPNFPAEYPRKKTCKYLLKTQIGSTIKLKFEKEKFHLQNYDFVYVYDGNSTRDQQLAKRTGLYHPNAGTFLVSTWNSMLVVFTSDASIVSTGFKAVYVRSTRPAHCGETYDASVRGFIKSPGYPHALKDERGSTIEPDCKYTITAKPGYLITLKFEDFSKSTFGNCKNYIKAYDGKSTSNRVLSKTGDKKKTCGFSLPSDLVSTGNSMLIVFTSGAYVTGRGFVARFSQSCSGTFDASLGGTIRSPNYPNKYPDNSRCNYLIEASPQSTIKVEFQAFGLEASFDFLTAYDGKSTRDDKLGKVTGYSIPGEFVSTEDYMLLVFMSDGSAGKSGFLAKISQVEKDRTSKSKQEDTAHSSAEMMKMPHLLILVGVLLLCLSITA